MLETGTLAEPEFFSVSSGLRNAAARTPDAPALLGETPLSWGALQGRAARVAARLQALGICPGARMAIWTPKGHDFITAIYGALEAGLAYVPLDPMQPSERAARILDQARPDVLVVSPDLLDHLPGVMPDSVRLVLFTDCDGAAALPVLPVPALRLSDLPESVHLPFVAKPHHIAAVLFTSGSTGTPKGVQMSYGNLAAFVGWAVAEYGLHGGDVIANHASFHFDLSTFDLFAAAQVGAAVWPIPTPDQSNVLAIAEGLAQHRVTTLYAVPSILAMLTRAGLIDADRLPHLRHVLFAGEVFAIGDLRALAARLPEGCTLSNLYGPTETNACTWHRVTPADLERDVPVPIGRPLPGQRAQILDPETRAPVPPGEKGELVIEGSMVTPGYINPPDEANQANHAARRHATGDIVSLRDGALVYHGRIDRIVKVQGNRVELGEIEAALSRHPLVRQAAVVQILGPRGADLVAFVAPDGAEAPAVLDLLHFLRTLVPQYMLPRHVKFIPDLPRTPNGKADLQHLRRMAEDQFLRAPLSRARRPETA